MSENECSTSRVAPKPLRRAGGTLVLVCVLLGLAACDRWTSSEERVERAGASIASGDYRAAMADLKTVLEKEPQNARARVMLGELSLWLGDTDAAEKEMKRALAIGSNDQATRNLQYEILLLRERYADVVALASADKDTPPTLLLVYQAIAEAGRGDLDTAEAQIAAALKLTPNDPQALLESARLAAARGDSATALARAEQLTQPERERARALLLRGSLLMGRGDTARARDVLTEAEAVGRKYLRVPEQLAVSISLTEANLQLGDLEAAGKSLVRASAWAPKSVFVHYLQARIALLKNDAVTAVAESQLALRIVPDHVPSQLVLAAAQLSRGSLEQAESTLTQLLASHPDNVAASKLLAQVYLGRKEPERATSVLASAAPNGAAADPQLDWLMGTALLQSGSTSGIEHLERSVAATPDDVPRRLQLAGAYIAARTPEKAVAVLRAISPDGAQAQRVQALLVLASVSGKSPADARREVDNLLASHGDDVALLSAAGAYLGTNGEIARGRAVLERAAALDPKASEPRVLLAQMDARSGNAENAAKRLTELLSIDAKHPTARLGLSELAWRKGDRAAARRWLEEAIGADPAAVDARLRLAQMAFLDGDASRGRDLLKQAIDVAADRKTALNAAGQVLARVGLTDEALAKFNEAKAAGLSTAALNAARLQIEVGRPADARTLLEAALTERPKWLEAERMLTELDAREGQVDRAIARLRTLAGEATPAVRSELEGDVYALARRFEPAIAAYDSALRLQPRAALAVKLFEVRRAAKVAPAERSLVDWLQRSPEDSDVRRILASFYQSSGRTKEALAQYERLLAQNRIDPISLNNLAWLMHEHGNPQALDLARKAHESAPGMPEIADTYGWILVQTGSIQEGLQVLERAAGDASQNGDIAYHLAMAHAKAGQTQRATQMLTKLLESKKEFASRTEAEKALGNLTSKTT